MLPREATKFAGKFCVKYKGYVKLQEGSSIGMLSSRWRIFIQHEVLMGKRIKHNKTFYLKKNNQGISWISEPGFKASKQPTTQITSFSQLCGSLQTVTHRVFILHDYFLDRENTKKIQETKFTLNTQRAKCIGGVLSLFFFRLGFGWFLLFFFNNWSISFWLNNYDIILVNSPLH